MLTTLQISSEELTKLNYERYHYPCPLVQKRLHSLYIKAVSGLSNEDVGNLTDAHRNSISEWVHLYQQGGIEALRKVRYGTNTSILEEHASSIVELLTKQPPRTIGEAMLKIQARTGIERSYSRVRAFMKRHQFRFLKIGHLPAKVNNTQQRQWVEQTLQPVIQAAKDEAVHLLFLDTAHFVLQPFVCCLWCVARLFIKASAGRHRINVIGAVHGMTKQISTYCNTTYIDAACLIAFLQQLKEQYQDKPMAIVLDNARYQHCFAVKTVAKSLGIHLLFLPPYSPNLNIIERLWKFTKKKMLYAQYYDNPALFHQTITSFFDTIHQLHQPELEALLTLKFQFFDNDIAHSYAA